MHLRHRLPEPWHQRQTAVDLIEDGRPGRLEKLGLPQDDQFGLDITFQFGPLAGQEVVAVERLQAPPHSAQLGPDAASLCFARMRREDEFDRQAVEGGLHLHRRDAGGGEFSDRGSQ